MSGVCSGLIACRVKVSLASCFRCPAGAGMGSGKRIQEDWKVVLGESALDIRPGHVSSAVDGSGGTCAVSL